MKGFGAGKCKLFGEETEKTLFGERRVGREGKEEEEEEEVIEDKDEEDDDEADDDKFIKLPFIYDFPSGNAVFFGWNGKWKKIE